MSALTDTALQAAPSSKARGYWATVGRRIVRDKVSMACALILIETVFSWPGSGLLLNSAIFQRDLPLLQGTILVLALFFVFLNLMVDIAQAAIDPRIKRS